ncbi:MAG: autotransporter outer membrane beta-barrel domain-containing protein [Planctomycetes bacterium]|nr:autotransporter outer membrane beta-barrel domain-containing protein [Planctomycetota bacterium]
MAQNGGEVEVTLGDSATLSCSLRSDGSNSGLSIHASDSAVISGDLSTTDNGSLTLNASDSVTIVGDITSGGTVNATFSDAVQFTGTVYTDTTGANTSTTTIALDNRASMVGDLVTGSLGTLNLTLTGESSLIGASISGGTVNMSIGSGASWLVTQASEPSTASGATQSLYASSVSGLTLEEGSWVYLGAKQYHMTGMADRVQLDVYTLSGTGSFELRPHVAGFGADAYNDGDLIHVFYNLNGASFSLYIPSTELGLGSVAVNGLEKLKVVHSVDRNADFSLYNGQLVDIGHLSYKLVKQNNLIYLVAANAETDGDEYVPSTSANPSGNAPVMHPDDVAADPGFNVILPTAAPLNRPAATAANFLTANYLITTLESQPLRQRLDDLRNCRLGDVWVQGVAGRANASSWKQLSAYSLEYYGFQIGADTAISAISPNFFAGIMAGYTSANPGFRLASGDLESFHAGLYALYAGEDNWYLDFTAKMSHLRNKFSTTASDGYTVSGKGSAMAYRLGLEAGKRWYFTDRQQGWYAEPFVQAQYTHQESMSTTATNGLKTRIDGYDSFQTRAGGRVGYDVASAPVPVNAYGMGAYVREFSADPAVTYNRVRHERYDFTGGWYEVGLGLSARFANRHTVSLEVEYASGKRFINRQASVGYQLSF